MHNQNISTNTHCGGDILSHEKNPYTQADMQEYFSSLPIFIQESIAQSGTKFDSLEQLQAFVANLEG